MKRLIWFEGKKILGRRISAVGILVFVLLNIIFLRGFISDNHTFDAARNLGKDGPEAVRMEQEIAARYAGPLTDEKVQRMLKDFYPTQDYGGVNIAYIYQNAMQSAVHARFADNDGSWNEKTVRDVFGKEEIEVGYCAGWLEFSRTLTQIYFMTAILLVVLLAPVFAGEYGGKDQILFASKYGQTRCALAKVIAAFMITGVLTAAVTLISLAAALLLIGTDGLDSSILFAPMTYVETGIPYNISCMTMLVYQTTLAFFAMAALTGMTLLVSALAANETAALAIAAIAFGCPLMLPIPEQSALYRLIVFFPVYDIQFVSVMSLAQIRAGLLYAVWALPAGAVLTVLGCAGANMIFSGREVI